MVVDDFNKIGEADIYFRWPDGTNRLYLNTGNGTSFTEIPNPIPLGR